MRGTITKKGKQWYIVVDTGKDENGKRQQKWISGFRTKKEAQLKMPEILMQLNNNTFVNPDSITVNEYLEIWLKDYATPNVSPTTLSKYVYGIKRISKYIGSMKLQKIKPIHIQGAINELNNSDLSSATVLDYYRTLNTAFNTAIKWQMINTNPCRGITPPKKDSKKMSVLNNEEARLLIQGTKDHAIHIVIFLALTCGLRRGEILGLQWEDIDFNNKMIHLTNNMVQADGKSILKDTKTSTGKRSIALPQNVVDELKQVRKNQIKYSLVFEEDYETNNFVCTWPDGKPFRPDYITQVFPKILKKLKLPNIRFHDLRHTHATLLLMQDVHPKVVQERLGHSKISITLDTYSHILPNMQQEAAEKIDKLFKG